MTTEQLLLDGLRVTQTKSLSVVRGDTKRLVFSHDLGASGNIKEARFELENATGTAIMQLTWADHADCFDFSTSGEGQITLCHPDVADSSTAGLSVGVYSFAVELIDQTDQVYTPLKGTLDLLHGVVDDDSTAAYLSWTTREAYNVILNGLLGMVYAGMVSTAAASGAGTIEVDGASDLFVATDTIWVQLGSPGGVTYESHTVDSVSGDVITLDASTLGDDVAAGNVVQLGA